jgi:hypothetical protein
LRMVDIRAAEGDEQVAVQLRRGHDENGHSLWVHGYPMHPNGHDTPTQANRCAPSPRPLRTVSPQLPQLPRQLHHLALCPLPLAPLHPIIPIPTTPARGSAALTLYPVTLTSAGYCTRILSTPRR